MLEFKLKSVNLKCGGAFDASICQTSMRSSNFRGLDYSCKSRCFEQLE